MKNFIFALIFGLSIQAHAQLNAGACQDGLNGQLTTTSHTTTIAGKTISYAATVGFMEVDSRDKTSKACIFFTSYVVPSNTPRPLTFAFNGGPGSASVWLHLGFLGPKRINMGVDGLEAPPLASALIPNEYSPLDVTDIVMIDPVATGFSSPLGQTGDKFFGAKNDYAAVANFIRNYLNTYNRWLSPKFIVGESYGGVRGSLLARYLQSDMFIGVDGVFFVSPELSLTSLDFQVPTNLPAYWSFFPSFATSAWYHKKIAAKYRDLDVATVYSQAKLFADTTYRNALESGNDFATDKQAAVAQTMSDFIGFSKEEVLAAHLKIDDLTVFLGLLGNKTQMVGRYDSRFVGLRSGDPSDVYGTDPSSSVIQYAYTAGINEYLRTELNFTTNNPYNIFGDIATWPYESDGIYFDVLDDLSHALADNSKLQIMIASGYFDLACPMGSVEFDLSQMPQGDLFKSRIKQTRYFGGHMMYLNPTALSQLKADFAGFVNRQSTTVASPRDLLTD